MKYLNLREQQLELLKMLIQIDEFCKIHNIKYSLGGGTLIGAVRHKGFIPWDDDVDLYMLRDEYNDFVNQWKKMPISSYILSPVNIYTGETKICNPNIKIIDHKGDTVDLFIDVFVYDGVPSNKSNYLMVAKSYRHSLGYFNSCKKRYKRWENNILFKPIFKKLMNYFNKRVKSIVKNLNQNYPISNADTIGLVFSYYGKDLESYMPKKYFSDTVDLSFEGHCFPCMNGYHEHLTDYYGDYMQLPNELDRIPKHTNKCFYTESK